MRSIAISLTFLLSGCGTMLDAIFGPDDWEPSGHMTVGGMVTANGGTMGPVNLYRPNPNEKPTIERIEVAEGKFLDVQVYANRCLADMEPIYVDYPVPTVYLCGKKSASYREHELAHPKGMKHTAWQGGPVATCATITDAGYKTKYVKGQRICIANDYEFVEK